MLSGIGTGLDVASSIYGLIQGIGQRRQGRRLIQDASNAPKYEIPQEIGQQLGLRQAMLNARQPAFQDLENDIFANQAASVFNARQAAPGSSALLGHIGTAQALTNKALRDAAMQESLQYEQRVRGLENAQTSMAKEREKAYQLNVYEPMIRDFYAGQDLMASGSENVMGGIRSLAGVAGNLYQSEGENKTLSLLFPNLFNQNKGPRMRTPRMSWGSMGPGYGGFIQG